MNIIIRAVRNRTPADQEKRAPDSLISYHRIYLLYIKKDLIVRQISVTLLTFLSDGFR